MIRSSRRPRALAAGVTLAIAVGIGFPATAGADPTATDPTVPTLRTLADQREILFGSGAINPSYLDDPRFSTTLAKHFNSLSPENELKFNQIEPQRNVFDFTKIDRLLEFAEAHGMAFKGHGLFSPGGFTPEWLSAMTDPAEIRAALRNHTDTIMQRYAGKIDRWDVMTEPLSTFGGTGLQAGFLYEKLGPDYISELFRMAHEADPAAKLFLNEALVEYYPTKANELYALVKKMVDDGVPIHGVGFEMHEYAYPVPAGAIKKLADQYHALGLDVAITELDVHTVTATGLTDDVLQKKMYHDTIAEALAAGIVDISLWGFDDNHLYTFIPGAKPMIFDEQYEPKAAFFGVQDALTRPSQTITFPQPPNLALDAPDRPLNATTSSGLAVTYSTATPMVCTVVAGKAHPLTKGTCTIAADQAGNTSFRPAARVTRSFAVGKDPILVTTAASSFSYSLITGRVGYATVVKSKVTGLPVVGVAVTTKLNGFGTGTGCTAVTNIQGVASCLSTKPTIPGPFVGFTAVVAESADHVGGSATGWVPL